jgi:hypothetical protein
VGEVQWYCRLSESFQIGGAERDRTVDLHNAIVALYQLSYGPQFAKQKEIEKD